MNIIATWKTALRAAFRERRHAAIAVFAAVLAFAAALWMANASVLGFIAASPVFSAASKAKLILSTLSGGFAAFKPASFAATAVIAVLFGVNMALTAHYFRCRARLGVQAGAGLVGAFVGMLGVGCAACGSVVVSAILGAGVTAGIVGLLPFDGLEFGPLGIAVLLVSIHVVAAKIAEPDACGLPIKS